MRLRRHVDKVFGPARASAQLFPQDREGYCAPGFGRRRRGSQAGACAVAAATEDEAIAPQRSCFRICPPTKRGPPPPPSLRWDDGEDLTAPSVVRQRYRASCVAIADGEKRRSFIRNCQGRSTAFVKNGDTARVSSPTTRVKKGVITPEAREGRLVIGVSTASTSPLFLLSNQGLCDRRAEANFASVQAGAKWPTRTPKRPFPRSA
jgi:hypothetical protein